MLTRFEPSQYIITTSGNKVSRKSKITGSDFIAFGGNCVILDDVTIRGDLRGTKKNVPSIILGKYVFIMQDCLIVPPYQNSGNLFKYYPLKCGSFVEFQKTSIIKASTIGNYVKIGQNCIIDNSVIVKDCCLIMNNCVIPANVVIPPFSIVEGNPGRITGRLNPNFASEFEFYLKTKYQYFVPK
eukprot:NODE_286_length_11757_cov_0.187768.p8 type:complete len:184 gc:universal NODE_286_length_11757_cov_0.187768:7767-7216(-)